MGDDLDKALAEAVVKLGNSGWSGLSPSDWADLISGIDDSCFDYDKYYHGYLSYTAWKILPKLADDYNIWGSFDAKDWIQVLSVHPRFADKCTEVNGWEKYAFEQYLRPGCFWESLLQKQPSLSPYCDKLNGWQHFYGVDWQLLLQVQPQFAEKCDKNGGWTDFRNKESYVGDYCPIGKKIYRVGWVDLLKDQPALSQYCDKYGDWQFFDGDDWLTLLCTQPQFADKCEKYKGWKMLSHRQRVLLLQKQPQFSSIFEKEKLWENLDGFDWVALLCIRPEFCDKCDEFGGWSKISHCGRWSDLLCLQPQFAKQCDVFNGWNDFDGFDWWQLLRYEPLFAAQCNACHGWKDIFDYTARYVDPNEYEYGEEGFHIMDGERQETYFDFESCQYKFPAEYEAIFSRNAKIEALVSHKNLTEEEKLKKPYYRTMWTIISDGRDIGFLPIDLYADEFWKYNPKIWNDIDISYWLYILAQHSDFDPTFVWGENYGEKDFEDKELWYKCKQSLLKHEKTIYSYFEKRNIWQQLSREDWEFVFPTNKHGANRMNRAAPFVSQRFWDAMLSIWPKFIFDTYAFSSWAYLLRFKPSLAEQCSKCDGWSRLDKDSWIELLDTQWHFLEKVNIQALGSSFWIKLLKTLPEKAELCDKYRGWMFFSGADWIDLISVKEKFVDKLIENEGWRKFTNYNWRSLLAKGGLLAEKLVQYVDWGRFDKNDWLSLISEQKQFAEALVENGLLPSFGWKNKEDIFTEVKLFEKKEREWQREADLVETWDDPVFLDELGQLHPNEGY